MCRPLRVSVLLVLTGCASAGNVEPGQAVTLPVGGRMGSADAMVRYIGIANDSRCPAGVQCIRAGDADVLLDVVTGGGAPSRVVLNTEGRTAADVGDWRIRLVELAPGPAPAATLRLDASAPDAAPP